MKSGPLQTHRRPGRERNRSVRARASTCTCVYMEGHACVPLPTVLQPAAHPGTCGHAKKPWSEHTAVLNTAGTLEGSRHELCAARTPAITLVQPPMEWSHGAEPRIHRRFRRRSRRRPVRGHRRCRGLKNRYGPAGDTWRVKNRRSNHDRHLRVQDAARVAL